MYKGKASLYSKQDTSVDLSDEIDTDNESDSFENSTQLNNSYPVLNTVVPCAQPTSSQSASCQSTAFANRFTKPRVNADTRTSTHGRSFYNPSPSSATSCRSLMEMISTNSASCAPQRNRNAVCDTGATTQSSFLSPDTKNQKAQMFSFSPDLNEKSNEETDESQIENKDENRHIPGLESFERRIERCRYKQDKSNTRVNQLHHFSESHPSYCRPITRSKNANPIPYSKSPSRLSSTSKSSPMPSSTPVSNPKPMSSKSPTQFQTTAASSSGYRSDHCGAAYSEPTFLNRARNSSGRNHQNINKDAKMFDGFASKTNGQSACNFKSFSASNPNGASQLSVAPSVTSPSSSSLLDALPMKKCHNEDNIRGCISSNDCVSLKNTNPTQKFIPSELISNDRDLDKFELLFDDDKEEFGFLFADDNELLNYNNVVTIKPESSLNHDVEKSTIQSKSLINSNVESHGNILSKHRKSVHRMSINQSGENQFEESENSCAICLVSLSQVSKFGIIECLHIYCAACILKWSEVTNLCPLCKVKFRKIKMVRNKKCKKNEVLAVDDGIVAQSNATLFESEEELEVKDKDMTTNDLQSESEDSITICRICFNSNEEGYLLLCDGCNDGYHTFCIELGYEIPEGSWFCQHCDSTRTRQVTTYVSENTRSRLTGNARSRRRRSGRHQRVNTGSQALRQTSAGQTSIRRLVSHRDLHRANRSISSVSDDDVKSEELSSTTDNTLEGLVNTDTEETDGIEGEGTTTMSTEGYNYRLGGNNRRRRICRLASSDNNTDDDVDKTVSNSAKRKRSFTRRNAKDRPFKRKLRRPSRGGIKNGHRSSLTRQENIETTSRRPGLRSGDSKSIESSDNVSGPSRFQSMPSESTNILQGDVDCGMDCGDDDLRILWASSAEEKSVDCEESSSTLESSSVTNKGRGLLNWYKSSATEQKYNNIIQSNTTVNNRSHQPPSTSSNGRQTPSSGYLTKTVNSTTHNSDFRNRAERHRFADKSNDTKR